MRDIFSAKGEAPIEFDGFEVSVFRGATDGIVTVQILSEGADVPDRFCNFVPKLRVVVNDSSEVLDVDGNWVGEGPEWPSPI